MPAVYETEADVRWVGIDPADWRNLTDPDDDEDDENDNDADVHVPYLESVLGFDPDEEWENDPTWNIFCATGPGGGIDASCSPGQRKEGGYDERSTEARQRSYELGRQLAKPEAGPDAEHVIGRLSHTMKLQGNDKTVLLHTNEWTPELNQAWLDVAIELGRPIRFAHPIKADHLQREQFNHETGEIEKVDTVTKHELRHLAKAGYKPRKDDKGGIIGMYKPKTTTNSYDDSWLDTFCRGEA